MSSPIITTDAELVDACRRLARAPEIAFDTEFVSEDTYLPELCLVQVAAGDELFAIDSLSVQDMTPFWELLAAPGHETIVHAGRQELMFSLEAIGRAPQSLFDVQLAAGMIGMEYPAGYGTLVGRLLNVKASKGETRTDWRRRPLSTQQIDYALDDVRHLARLRKLLGERLAELEHQVWFDHEMEAWQTDVIAARDGERWRRVSGSSGLSSRSLSIVRELWLWREEESRRRNRPTRLVLRDDLIVELAKRRSSDPKQVGAIRGMERGDLKRLIPDISKAIAHALALSDDQCPQPMRSETNSHLTMLGQFLSSALGSICRRAQVAASLVGTPSDVRDLIAWRLGETTNGEPVLAQGWRAEVVGQLLDDLLAGKVAIRIEDPHSDQPFSFESVPGE